VKAALHRVVKVGKVNPDTELLGNRLTERLDTIALSCVVACADKPNARLTREMHRRLRDFASDKHWGAPVNGLVKHVLGRPGTPSNPLYG
jgi:hypothetical protein